MLTQVKSYNIAIVGAGSAGLSAADIALNLGLKSVALIEASNRLGGECLHSGCVPSKTLLHQSDLQKPQVYQEIRSSIDHIESHHDNPERYKKGGIDVFHSKARFLARHELQLEDGTKIRSKKFLIATGSMPFVPPIEGLNNTPYRTNETIFELKDTPKSLAIIGAGPIGCELAFGYAKLGTKVTLINNSERILSVEPPEASTILEKKLQAQGVTILQNAETKQVKHDKKFSLELTVNKKGQLLTVDELLVATGRRANISELGLKDIGVKCDKGILTNVAMQTSVSNIYAAGDCIAGPKFTHIAGHQAATAVRNMLFPLFRQKSPQYFSGVPAITYTNPQIASLGKSKAQLDSESVTYELLRMEIDEIDRAVTDDARDGYIELYVGGRDRLLGASIVSHQASEILAPLALCFYNKLPVTRITKAVMAYPTVSTGLHGLISNYQLKKLSSNKIFKAFFS